MNNLSFKRLDIEYILNMNTKLKKDKRKIKFDNYIIAICLSIIIIFIIIGGVNIFYLSMLIYCLLVILIRKQRNLIVCGSILKSILKRDFKSIEFDENNIKVFDGKKLLLNSYISINEVIEYKNFIEIKYIPIKNSKYGDQIILIPKDEFENKDELIKFKELIISKINKEQFKVYDEDFKIEDRIEDSERFKCKVYLITFIILFIYIMVWLYNIYSYCLK